jgi:pyridoxal phosphate enzyme (YggS family)
MTDLDEIIGGVKKRIQAACARSGRNESEIEIIAVTKTHGEETVREAWECGLGIVGENKVQEAAWKKARSISGPEWHLIGHLQGNKVRAALEIFDFFHSVDSVKLLRRINAVAEEIGAAPHILLEVNVSGEKSKTGMKPEEVDEAVRAVMESCPRITLEGFMTMAPFSENPEDARPYFRSLRKLRDEVERRYSISLPRLSMGMSGDYEVAIEEGATWIRLGTVLFGERPKIKRVTAAADDGCSAGGLDSYSGEGTTCRILD